MSSGSNMPLELRGMPIQGKWGFTLFGVYGTTMKLR